MIRSKTTNYKQHHEASLIMMMTMVALAAGLQNSARSGRNGWYVFDRLSVANDESSVSWRFLGQRFIFSYEFQPHQALALRYHTNHTTRPQTFTIQTEVESPAVPYRSGNQTRYSSLSDDSTDEWSTLPTIDRLYTCGTLSTSLPLPT